jgi:hypothetical protein
MITHPRFSAESTVLLATVDRIARPDGKKHVHEPRKRRCCYPFRRGETPNDARFYRRGQVQVIDNVMDIFEAGR